jgi:hypothetical protein
VETWIRTSFRIKVKAGSGSERTWKSGSLRGSFWNIGGYKSVKKWVKGSGSASNWKVGPGSGSTSERKVGFGSGSAWSHQSEKQDPAAFQRKQDPDTHQGDSDPQHSILNSGCMGMEAKYYYYCVTETTFPIPTFFHFCG